MANFSMFSDEMLSNAINSKDRISIINLVIQTVNNDISFSNGEFDRLISIIKEKFPDAFDSLSHVDGEYELPKEDWNKEYFEHLLFNLRSNFCVERAEVAEEVGKFIISARNGNPTYPQVSQKEKSQPAKTESGNRTSLTKIRKNGTMNYKAKYVIAIVIAILIVFFIVMISVKSKSANLDMTTAGNKLAVSIYDLITEV